LQAPSTAISWSVYEFFKHYLNLGSDGNDDDKYDTMSVMNAASRSGQVGSRVGHLSPASGGSNPSNEDHATATEAVSRSPFSVVAAASQ
jgi:hypothetical protein